QSDCDRCLARAAYIDIADHYYGQWAVIYPIGVLFVAPALARNDGLHYPGKRQQQRTAQALPLPDAVHGLCKNGGRFQRGLCVAKLTRSTPARRAASMTRTTDSWVDWASAFMTRTASLRP